MLNAIGITVTGPSKFAKQLFQALAFGTDLAFAAGEGLGGQDGVQIISSCCAT